MPSTEPPAEGMNRSPETPAVPVTPARPLSRGGPATPRPHDAPPSGSAVLPASSRAHSRGKLSGLHRHARCHGPFPMALRS